MIRSDYCTLSAHTRLSTHYYIRTFSVCYQRILKYTQRTTMYAPTHNTKSTHVHLAMYIHNNIRIAQSETLYTNDHLSLKRVASITITAKRNFTKIVSLKNSTPSMWYIQYERILIPCMKNDKHVTIPRIIG